MWGNMPDRERDAGVGEELERLDVLAAHQHVRMRLGEPRHRRREPAELVDDHPEGDEAEGQQDHGLEHVDPDRAAHAAVGHVGQHHRADHQPAHPVGHLPVRHLGEGRAAAHDADQEVGDEQRDLHDEDQQAEPVRAPPLAEVLHRGQIAAPLAERPDAGADEEEDHRDDQARRRGHQREDADPLHVGLARGAEQGERGHVGAEERDQEDERPERAGGDEEVLAGAAEEAVAEEADHQHDRQVDDDDREVIGRSSSLCRSRCSGQAWITSSVSTTEVATQKPMW